MKVLLIAPAVISIPPLGYGGIEWLLYDYGKALAKYAEVTLAAPKFSHIPNCEDISTVDVQNPLDQWREDKAYKAYQRRLTEFDVIHDLSHRKIAGRLKSNLPQISVLWHAYSMGAGNYPEPKYNLLAVGKWHAETMAQQYKQQVKWVHWGIDTTLYAPKPDQEVGEFYVYVGHPAVTKGMWEAINMCIRTKQKLKIIGGQIPGEGTQYRDRAMALCDGKNIVWLGEISHERKRDELAGAKALLFPIQQDEGSSLTIMEALACGTPVLTSNRGGYPEMLTPETGVLCKSEPEFERILATKAWTDGYDRKKIREHAIGKFSLEVCVKNYLEIYKSVSEGLRW